MRRNLVLARVGRSSLHPEWLAGGEDRTWDLQLSPYQEIDPQTDLDCTVGDVVAGPKWSGIREVLHSWDGWRDYERIWLPDDDISTTAPAIDALFDAAEGVELDLFAPALDRASYFAHFSTKQNDRFFGRWVGFVEIMVPGFRVAVLERLLPTLDLSETGWGWGLDSVWPKLLGYENVGVIDGVTVTHTRPVGQMRDVELSRRVRAESDHMFERYDCEQVHTTFGAFGPDLKPVDVDPQRLLADLVGGWQELIDEDPRVLLWIVAFQQERLRWPDYPVEGTP